MIIEAAPRLRDRPLEDYPSSPSKSGFKKTQLGRETSEHKVYQKLVESRNYCNNSKIFDPEKTRADLLDCDRTVPQSKWRKISCKGHPYDWESKDKRGGIKKNYLLPTLPNHNKCPSLLPQEKAGDFLQRFSPVHKRKIAKRNNRAQFMPIFTANANENNDNCPNATYCHNQLNESQAADTICDVEIEDLTTERESTHLSEELNPWRQRRKSFNTNPLSSTAARKSSNNPPSLLYLEDLFRGDSVQSATNASKQSKIDKQSNFYQFVCQNIQCDHSTSPTNNKVPDHWSQNPIGDLKHETRKAESVTGEGEISSIERLVEFFESNSTANSLHKTSERTQPENLQCKDNIHHNFSTNAIFRQSLSSQTQGTTHQQQRRPSIAPFGIDRHSTHKSSFDISQVFRNNWESVIKNSSEYFQTNTNTSHNVPEIPVGGIYNNNGNAASAPPESKFIWPGRQYASDHFPPLGRYDNSRKPSSPSPVFFRADRGRCASSLARVAPDVELIDLESTRLSAWQGAHPIPAAFDRHQQQHSTVRETGCIPFSSLIDLQSTSNRVAYQSNKWLGYKDSKSVSKSSRHSQERRCLTPTATKTDKVEENFQKSFCQIRAQERKSLQASQNNHHNAPVNWHCSEFDRLERKYQDSIQERQFPFGNFNLQHTLLNPFLRKGTGFLQSDSHEMGCIQSIAKAKVSPDRCHHGIIVEDIQAAIDRTPTEIEEKSPIVLRYRTPYFRASAHVIVPPITRKETWTVGWIQACDAMKFINQYGNMGNSSWEIPALKDRRITAVSDSDGVSYPWYGNTTEIATVEGPTDTSRSLTLRMNDNFYPSVTWDIPVSEGSEAHLTHIVRDQSFTTWLAAVNQTTGRLEVLRTVKWHFYLEIDVDPTQELGKRAHIVSPLVQKQPIILKNNTEPIYISSPHRSSSNGSTGSGRPKRLNRRPGAGGDNNSNNHTNFIPKSALVRPSANNAQTLIWRPTRDVPVIVVPAKEEYKENNEVVWFTRTPTMHGHDHNVRILSSQEMTQLKKTIS